MALGYSYLDGRDSCSLAQLDGEANYVGCGENLLFFKLGDRNTCYIFASVCTLGNQALISSCDGYDCAALQYYLGLDLCSCVEVLVGSSLATYSCAHLSPSGLLGTLDRS